MLSITLKVRKDKTSRAAEEEMSRATPPHTASKLKDRQLSREWSEWVLSSNLCLDSDEARRSHLQGLNTRSVWCGAEGFYFFPPLRHTAESNHSAASSITSRNKHYNHVLHPCTDFLGTERKSKEDSSSLSNKERSFLFTNLLKNKQTHTFHYIPFVSFNKYC